MTTESEDFIAKKRDYFFRFARTHMRQMQQLREGKVLGPESQGWRNVSEHCLLAGVMAHTLGRLVGLSAGELATLTSEALTHDWNKRIEKEAAEITSHTDSHGDVIVDYDPEKVIEQELSKTGPIRVTGNDWRDFDTWNNSEKILRYVDSCLGSTPEGKADIVPWQKRINDLKVRHPQVNEEGRVMYGIPLYDKLTEVTWEVEDQLYQLVIARNPDFASRYSTSSQLMPLVRNTIIEEINTA